MMLFSLFSLAATEHLRRELEFLSRLSQLQLYHYHIRIVKEIPCIKSFNKEKVIGGCLKSQGLR